MDAPQEAAANLRPLTEVERAYVRDLEDPYASLSVGAEMTEGVRDQAVNVSGVLHVEKPKPVASKRDFEAECLRIFRQYIPPTEKGRIRRHHREFIDRNRSRPPLVRYRLLEGLRKYDLSGIKSLTAQFNRERTALTVEKLKKIEHAAMEDDAR